ncbi:MAG TPA: prephenate dehydrogenase/arogenate dehydrogenase family protein, partial [Firmicutes bacterium]|nr:prephenate dehydrogenase/arogenate dehydrogenase family protein [Bacillota bacterium]
RAVAVVSHLPHLVAAALAGSASSSDKTELIRTLAAGGFRDTTRIALGNPEIWRDICISNSAAILQAMADFKRVFKQLYCLVDQQEAGKVEEFLQQAREFRRSVPHRGRGILPELYEIVVLVPDTPGMIGELASLLGEAGINISSIEILHARELEGGSIRLGFRELTHQQAALNLLRGKGYRAHRRN